MRPPSATNHQRQTPTDARGEVRGQGRLNQGLSAPPKKGTVGAGSVATTRTSRERLDGRTGVPTTRCRAPTPALSKELRAPATVAACGRRAHGYCHVLSRPASPPTRRAVAVVGAWICPDASGSKTGPAIASAMAPLPRENGFTRPGRAATALRRRHGKGATSNGGDYSFRPSGVRDPWRRRWPGREGLTRFSVYQCREQSAPVVPESPRGQRPTEVKT